MLLTTELTDAAAAAAAASFSYYKNVEDSLENKLSKIFDEMDTLPLSISKNGIQVRTKWEGNNMVAVSEAKNTPYHPNQFRSFLENFSEDFPKVNPMAKQVVPLKKDGNREGVKSFLQFPFPLKNRVMIHWKYLQLDRNPDEHLVMFSEEGNEELLKDKYYTNQDKKKFVLGRTFLCAYWVKPVYKGEEVIGSDIRYAFCGDTGGSIPQFVQDMVGPKTAYDSINGLLDFVENKK